VAIDNPTDPQVPTGPTGTCPVHRHRLAAAPHATSMLAVDLFHVDCAVALRRIYVRAQLTIFVPTSKTQVGTADQAVAFQKK
jgi:hypothetical protein